MRPFRLAVSALAALVVLSLGFALVPAKEPAPAGPPFSERARASAFTDAMQLRAAGRQLASAGAADSGVLDGVVTLLTIQARALQSPAPVAASPSPSASGPTADPVGIAELVRGLAESGRARVQDAETADGGMARLLAGTGTAQLLAAGRLAAAAGLPAPQATAPGQAGDVPEAAPAASPCLAPSSPGSTPGAGSGTPATVREALAAVVAAEQQAVYGYQAALPRLAPAEAGPASELLERHEDLAAAAGERLQLACGPSVPQQPGYVIDAGFLAAPSAGLGKLEAATLASYGDVVALAQGQDRVWALSALQSAAGRAVRWGSDPGPVPGLTLDVGQLPVLAGATGPSPAAS